MSKGHKHLRLVTSSALPTAHAPQKILRSSTAPEGSHALIQSLISENTKLKTAYEKLLEQTTEALMQCVEARDEYTYGHCQRVKEYSLLLGKAAGLSPHELKQLELSALFHDLGKIGVRDCILLKPEKINLDEQHSMRDHPVIGAKIVGIIDAFHELVPGILHHHERIDGSGYPSGLEGDQIPMVARILLVVDAFDAMTSTRPYRKALSVEKAYAELKRCAGTQFDTKYVEIFLKEHQRLFEKQIEKNARKLKKAA